MGTGITPRIEEARGVNGVIYLVRKLNLKRGLLSRALPAEDNSQRKETTTKQARESGWAISLLSKLLHVAPSRTRAVARE